MKHEIYQFVITGGPCAGKSTCLSKLENALTNRGIKTIVVPETATEIMNSGMSHTCLPTKIFQEIIIHNSLAKEKSARRAADYYAKNPLSRFCTTAESRIAKHT